MTEQNNMAWASRPLDYEPPEIDTTKAHSARIYDYLLGGKDNYPPDREFAEHILEDWPGLRDMATQSRRFMHRVTRYLAAERGVDQFLDLGTGIPTSPNLHEIAQGITPSARVVYVDNDPIVLAHAEALLTSTPEGRVAYVHADLRETDAILDRPDVRGTLDLDRPVALSMLTVLHLITDDDEICDMIARYLARLPRGSSLALSVLTRDSNADRIDQMAVAADAHGMGSRNRTRAEIVRFFDGLDLIPPGIAFVNRWHPDAASAQIDGVDVSMYGAVAVKP